MGALLANPAVWFGLMALLGAFLWMGKGGGNSKKRAARIARMKRKKAPSSKFDSAGLSLRRVAPGSNTAIGQILSSMSSISRLRGRLEVAGMTETSPQKFLGIIGGITVFATLVLWLVLHKSPLVCLPVGVLVGLGVPHFVVNRKIKKRQLAFLKLFPDAIELMVRGLKAGLPVGESFITVSKELPPPMGDTFGAIAQQTQLGVPMEKGLQDAAKKLSLTEFNFFVTTIILQRETGGNLGEILTNLADMLRQRHMMKLKITALSSEARASAYIVGALPFLVFTILQIVSPTYLKVLFDDPRGNHALMGAMGSLLFGAFIMKRMTQLEI